MRVRVIVKLKPGVLDVQGKAVEQGLIELGNKEVANVRVGRIIELDVADSTLEAAKPKIDEMCRVLLANPIIENYQIEAL